MNKGYGMAQIFIVMFCVLHYVLSPKYSTMYFHHVLSPMYSTMYFHYVQIYQYITTAVSEVLTR